MDTPRSCIISSRFRRLNAYAKYQRTHVNMMSNGKRTRLITLRIALLTARFVYLVGRIYPPSSRSMGRKSHIDIHKNGGSRAFATNYAPYRDTTGDSARGARAR